MTNPGPPIPKARARTANGHAYTPKRTKVAEEEIALRLKLALPKGHQLDKSVFYSVEAHFHMPNFRRSDVDNLLKLILDAANGIVWPDDMQVVEVHGYVVRGSNNPRTYVTITTVANPHGGTVALEGIAS